MEGRAEEAEKHRRWWRVEYVEVIVVYMKFESERRGRKHTVLGVVESPERW